MSLKRSLSDRASAARGRAFAALRAARSREPAAMVNNSFPARRSSGRIAAVSAASAAPARVRLVKEIANQSLKFSENSRRIRREGRTLPSTGRV
jgi:hypothetical protein